MLARFTDVSSTRNSNGTVGIAAKKSGVLADRSPSGRQRSDFYELPDLNHFLRPAAVPVIAIPLAFRRAASRPWKRQTVQPFKA